MEYSRIQCFALVFRDLQFDKLADRLLELKSENDCEEIWILGDFLRVPNSKQRVNNRLRKFIQKLCDNTSKVRFILGNHDTESKSSTQELDDSVLGMTTIIPNFIYEDHHIEHFDGHTFAFMNWYPDQNLEWIADKVDVMLGHYTKSNLFGQDIDESKFDLMIHGDIHNDQVIGKFVSVGTRPYGYSTFEYDLTPYINKEGVYVNYIPETQVKNQPIIRVLGADRLDVKLLLEALGKIARTAETYHIADFAEHPVRE